MVVGFDVRCYFTPSMLATPAMVVALGADKGWKRPFELCYRNSADPDNVVPDPHQYIAGRRFENGYFAPISYIELTKHLYQGSYGTVVIESLSDRDFFDLVNTEKWEIKTISNITTANPPVVTTVSSNTFDTGDHIWLKDIVGMEQLNERAYHAIKVDAYNFQLEDYTTMGTTYISGGTATKLDHTDGYPGGYQMPHIDFPYRAWEINLKGKDDTGYPATPMFRGMRTRIRDITIGDIQITDIQDKLYRWELELQSFENWNLQRDRGIALWYHRKNKTKNTYHLAFDTSHNISFDDAITQVVAWMNAGSPTEDFPITYTYTPHGVPPYTTKLNSVVMGNPQPLVETEQASTWEILTDLLNMMGVMEGAGVQYAPICSVDGAIDSFVAGYDTGAITQEDFRTHEDMQQNADTTITIDFTRIHVQFSGLNQGEYWIKLTLQKFVDSDWDTDYLVIPSTGYEYVPYDKNARHGYKNFDFTKLPAGRYKWAVDVIPSTSVIVDEVGSYAATAPAYTLQASNSERDTNQVETFFMTRGACVTTRQTIDTDGVITFEPTACQSYVYGLCPDTWGCYPDPIKNTPVALTGTLSFVVDEATVTGVGTLFLTELVAGDLIKHNAQNLYYEVASIESNVSLTLTTVFSDPWFAGNMSGASSKSGAISSNETFNTKYGFMSSRPLDYMNTSLITNSWNTKCRLNSKRQFDATVNSDLSVREPINVHLEFTDGWTNDEVGQYCSYFSPSANKEIVFRVIQQTHTLQGGRLRTKIDGYQL